MAIAFGCECGKQFTVSDEYAGKRTKCPACGAALTVPALVATDAAIPASAEDEAYHVLADSPEPEGEVVVEPPALARRDPDPGEIAPPPRPQPKFPPAAPQPKRPQKKRTASPDDQHYERPRIHISPAVMGGLGSMTFGAIWFFVGLAGNRIYFYAPVLFFFGLVAVIRGVLGYAED